MHQMASNNSITLPIAGPACLSSNYFQPVPVYTHPSKSNHRSNRSRSTSEMRSESSSNHHSARRRKKKKRCNHHDQDTINDTKQDPSQRKHKKKKKKRRNHRMRNYRTRSHSNSFSDTPGMDRHISNQGVPRQNSLRPGQHQSNSNNFYHNPSRSGRATSCSVSIERSNSFAPQLVKLPKPPNSLNKLVVKHEDCMSSISSQGTTRAAATGSSQSPFFELPHSSSLQLFE